MDRAQYVHKRKAKYMAQTLEAFEADIEPHLPVEAAGKIQSFKGLVRARMNALATDAVDIISLGETAELNGVAQELRDQVSPVGRP
jgi:hypothetical protein